MVPIVAAGGTRRQGRRIDLRAAARYALMQE
jgi:hypothetical protein